LEATLQCTTGHIFVQSSPWRVESERTRLCTEQLLKGLTSKPGGKHLQGWLFTSGLHGIYQNKTKKKHLVLWYFKKPSAPNTSVEGDRQNTTQNGDVDNDLLQDTQPDTTDHVSSTS